VTTSTTRPVPLSRVWSGRKVLAEDLGGEDLADVLDLHAGANAWWVLDRTSDYAQDELRRLAAALDLDELAVSDLTAQDHRVKFEEIGQARLVATSAVALDAGAERLSTHPISLLVTDRAVVCLVDSSEVLNPARLLNAAEPRLAGDGLDAALKILLGAVIDGYAAVVEWLEVASDELADALFEERPLTRNEQLRAFRLRKMLSELHRLTDPMRTVMADLSDAATGNKARTRGWMLLAEKHARVANAADQLRDTLASVFETSLALADVQLNTIMKKLTGWAAIIAVPTLVTSFVGMNVGFPLIGTVSGFWFYLVIMVSSAALLWLLFRRRDWI
jgi:magnesium transporter